MGKGLWGTKNLQGEEDPQGHHVTVKMTFDTDLGL